MKRSESLISMASFFTDNFKKAGLSESFINTFENKVAVKTAELIANEEGESNENRSC